jgi:DNA-binding CsgD family transcriptional regulator
MLEQLHVVDPDVHQAELAYHFRQAAPLGALRKAIDYTVRTAERSLRALAYEEASRTYEQALDLLTLQEAVEASQRADLLLALGQAQARSGATPQAKQTFTQAAVVARQLHDAKRLAQAALGFAGDVVRPGVSDEQVITHLNEALELSDETERVLRVRLLARLAMEYRFSSWRVRGEELSGAALASARHLGDALHQEDGRAALVYALNARHFAILAPDTLEERMAISLELVELAAARGDRELLLQSLPWRVADLLTMGQSQAADAAIAQASALAAELRQPLYLWYAHVFGALRALMIGDWTEGERLAEAAYQIGERVQPGGAAVYLAAQQFMVRWEQGRLAEMVTSFTELVARFPAMPVLRCFRALACWHAGNHSVAQAELARLCVNRAAALTWDQLWLGGVATLAELTILLGDRTQAALLYELLLPYAERNVMVGVPNCLGAVAAYLGALAACLGRREAASAHFTTGLTINQQLNIRPFLARTQVRYAALLLQGGSASERSQAHDLLAQAQATAEALDLVALRTDITPLLAPPTAPPLPGLTPRELAVLRLIVAGHSTKAMAVALVISVPTVERHITHIYEKLGVTSRAEATAYALRQGLV